MSIITEKNRLTVKLLVPEAKAPTVAHPGEDLGYDLYALEETLLRYGRPTAVRTGIAAAQEGHGFIIKDRSSVASKAVVTSGGVIDAGYRGEIKVLLTNWNSASEDWDSSGKHRQATFIVKPGDKIAQIIPVPVLTQDVEVVEELPAASRGDRGFGSSGR